MGSKPSINTSVAAGQALCGLVHDISNIVQTVLLRAEVAMSTSELGDDVCEAFEKIIDDSKRSVDVLRYLLEHSRLEVEKLPPLDIAKTIEAAVEELGETSEAGNAIEFCSDGLPFVTKADEGQLKELVAILTEEMFREAGNSTTLRITLGSTGVNVDADADTPSFWMDGMNGIKLSFVRDGPGAPLEIEDGLLELPTSLDEPPHVLQLLRAKGIIRQHRGQFRVSESVDDNGQKLSLEIFLPFQGA